MSEEQAKQMSPEVQAALEKKVTRYYELDSSIKEQTKEKDPLNKEIKEAMFTWELEELAVGDVVASYSSYDKSSLNQEKLLAFLESRGLESAIKTVRMPDDRVVEDLLHQGHIKAEEIAHCLEVKPVEVLSVKKSKKKAATAKKPDAVTYAEAAAPVNPAPKPTKNYGDTF